MTWLIGTIIWAVFVIFIVLFMMGANRNESVLNPGDEFYGQDK